jgi:hypothetical protein
MSRSGYSDDCDNYGLWLGAVQRAATGYRGQHLLRKLRDALDAMPVKRLIVDAIKDEKGDVCALGALDPNAPVYDAWDLAKHFGIARALAAEIVYRNDEYYEQEFIQCEGPAQNAYGWNGPGSVRVSIAPEQRWIKMRAWVDEQIIDTPPVDESSI